MKARRSPDLPEGISQPRPSNVAIFGNLGNIGYCCAQFLRKVGIEVNLFVGRSDLWRLQSFNDSDYPSDYPWITKYQFLSASLFYQLSVSLRNYDVVQASTMWSALVYPFARLHRKPFIAWATGSDLREMVWSKTVRGRLLKAAFANADCLLFCDIGLIPFLKQLSPCRSMFIPCPFELGNSLPWHKEHDHRLLVFHFSRLDYTEKGKPTAYTDGTQGRLSTKGNDVFFKGLALAVASGAQVQATVVEVGGDVGAAHHLTKALGIDHIIKWIPPQNKDGLSQYIEASDVTVDQFELGALGLVALESMAAGRPCLTWVNPDYIPFTYKEMPPVLNAHSPEEVARALINLSTRQAMAREIGNESRRWIEKYHAPEKITERLLEIYSTPHPYASD